MFLLKQFDLHLLLGFFEQELSLSDDLLALLESLLDLTGLLQDADIVAILEFFLLLLEELGTGISPLIQLFCLQLHIYEVCIFEHARELVKFLLL